MSRKSATGRRELEQKTGYAFTDKALLDGALTHILALSHGTHQFRLQRPTVLPRRGTRRNFIEGGLGHLTARGRGSRCRG
jgi:hypothetical protein